MSELELIYEQLQKAKLPEDIFGLVFGSPTEVFDKVQSQYKALSKAVHPDHHKGDKRASDAFTLLTRLWNEAKGRIEAGMYGKHGPILTLTTKTATYEVFSKRKDTLYTVEYSGRWKEQDKPVLIRICDEPANNDLLVNEARIIKLLRGDARGVALHDRIPEIIDSFKTDNRQINVFTDPKVQLHSLQDVINAYPMGIDPRDMVWMWKRTLAAVGLANKVGVVHGGLIPPVILLDIVNHGAVVGGWENGAVLPNEHPKVVIPAFNAYYPDDLHLKKVYPSTDMYMVAKCMIRLVGGDLKTNSVPSNVPFSLAQLLRGCTMKSPEHRLDDAWWLHKEIDGMLIRIFGPRKFRPFNMPVSPVNGG